MLLFTFGTTPDMRERLAYRHAWVWIKTDHSVLASVPALEGPCDFCTPLDLGHKLKAINPEVKVGMYVGGLASPDSHHPHYAWLDDADLLHASPTQPLIWSPTTVPHQPGERRVKVINYTRPETRAKLVEHWRAFLQLYGLDGLTFDTWHPEYYGAWISQPPATPNAHGGWGLPNGGVEGAFHTEPWWFEALKVFTAELRWALAQDGREVWVNGLYDYPGYNPNDPNDVAIGRGFTTVAQHASGLLSEYGHVMHKSPADLRGYVESGHLVNAQSRGTFWLLQPGAFAYDPSGYTVADSLDTQRFYLACYLLVQAPPYTHFGYHSGPMYQAYQVVDGCAEPWLYDGGEDWEQDYGVAKTDVRWAGNVAWVEYTNGYAIVNASGDYGYLTLPPDVYRNWHPTGGGIVEITTTNPGMNVPPKYGMYLFKGGSNA
jgi:hypothetical protein